MTITRKRALERLDVLSHELSTMESGGRNDFLNRVGYELGGYVACSSLDATEAVAALEHAAHACGLDAAEARYTIHRSLQEGARKPLNDLNGLPALPRPSPYQKAQEKAAQWTPLSLAERADLAGLLAPLGDHSAATQELRRRGLWPSVALTAFMLTRPFGRLARAGALVFEVRGPDADALAYKLRNPGGEEELKVAGLQRYAYLTKGHGTPAWCSPAYGSGDALLIVEGEPNAAAGWTAARQAGLRLDVQGLAGAGGMPHLRGIEGRTVYLYADDDDAGHKCLERVAHIAQEAGACEVRVLPFLSGGLDFCDLLGAGELAEWLPAALQVADLWQSVITGKTGLQQIQPTPSGQKADLWHCGSTHQGWAATNAWNTSRRGGW